MTQPRATARADDASRRPSDRPTVADLHQARERLTGRAVRTPLLASPHLDRALGGRILIKAEPLQKTGSFKYRGAFNKLSTIPETRRSAGVIAYSSGNHAQGVAAAAHELGIPATILMPEDAPAIKRADTEAWDAEIRPFDRHRESREAIGAALAEQAGATLVKPYDDPEIIAGQGTVGLEIVEQCAELGVRPDRVIVCCGGGGLVSGIALGIKASFPDTRVHSAEPEGFDDMARSLATGVRVANPPGGRSICDAILTPMPGEITFAIARALLSEGLAVSDGEVRTAMRVAAARFKLVVEPGGAVALAAVLAGRVPVRDRVTVVVASGGNVDPEILRGALAAEA